MKINEQSLHYANHEFCLEFYILHWYTCGQSLRKRKLLGSVKGYVHSPFLLPLEGTNVYSITSVFVAQQPVMRKAKRH